MRINAREKRLLLDAASVENLVGAGAPTVQFYRNGGELMALCPFHPDRQMGSFALSVDKRCWHCFACGAKGNIYDLFQRLNNWSYLQTIDYLYDHIEDVQPGNVHEGYIHGSKQILKMVIPERSTRDVIPPPLPEDPLTADEISIIYGCFAKAAGFSPRQRDGLMARRGLHAPLDRHFFQFPDSMDDGWMSRFQAVLREEAAGLCPGLENRVLGAPGFCWDVLEQKLSFSGVAGGIGILLHDLDGRITGIQERLPDECAMQQRYIYFSSANRCRADTRYQYGLPATTQVDIVPPESGPMPGCGIAITEGKFKAMHLSYLGYTALSLQGVSSWNRVLPVLRELKSRGHVGNILIAFDADCTVKASVARCAANLGHALLAEGCSVRYLTWPIECGKGLDDALLAGHRDRMVQMRAERFINTVLAPLIRETA